MGHPLCCEVGGVLNAHRRWRGTEASLISLLSSDGARPKGLSSRSLSKALSTGFGCDLRCCGPVGCHSRPVQPSHGAEVSKGTACGRVGVIACRTRSAPRLLREQKGPHVK